MSARERFTEFATSGAFTITLTRSQVGQLSMLSEGADLYGCASLFRKGLAEELSRPDLGDDRVEYRASRAGLLVAQLCHLAGLTNSGGAATAAEIERLHAEVSNTRARVAELQRLARSACARRGAAEAENSLLRAQLAGVTAERDLALRGMRLKAEFRAAGHRAYVEPQVTLRDPHPDLSDDDLEARIESPAAQTVTGGGA